MQLKPHEMLRLARLDNPRIRYALRKNPGAKGESVLGAFCTNAGGFIPVAIETERDSGYWDKLPYGYLEIDGKAVGIEAENWQE